MDRKYAVFYIVSDYEITLIGFIKVKSPIAPTREKIVDKVITDRNFIEKLDECDESWWYNTDKLVISLYK